MYNRKIRLPLSSSTLFYSFSISSCLFFSFPFIGSDAALLSNGIFDLTSTPSPTFTSSAPSGPPFPSPSPFPSYPGFSTSLGSKVL